MEGDIEGFSAMRNAHFVAFLYALPRFPNYSTDIY